MSKFIHKGKEKKIIVQKMFDDISYNYDFLNHFLSFGIDIYWRRKFIKELPINNNSIVLDVATGTGDIAFQIKKKYGCQIIGLDYSNKMLNKAVIKSNKKKTDNILFIQGDAEYLPIKNNSIDIITISYGFRNLGNFNKALKEFNRVLKSGGMLGILEFSNPKSIIFSKFFKFYFKNILPFIGKILSGSNAYNYLPESVTEFFSRNQLIELMKDNGFTNCSIKDLTYGTTSIFKGIKI